jgi:periplasmic protein TonB
VEGGAANGLVPTGNEVFMEAIVEEKPSVLSAPPPPYPDMLKQAGIQGRVLIQAVIDTTGRAEPNSVKILQSPNPGFEAGSRSWIMHALFRPARVHGRAVRVLIQVPLDYKLTGR